LFADSGYEPAVKAYELCSLSLNVICSGVEGDKKIARDFFDKTRILQQYTITTAKPASAEACSRDDIRELRTSVARRVIACLALPL